MNSHLLADHESKKIFLARTTVVRDLRTICANRLDLAKMLSEKNPDDACAILDFLAEEDAKIVFSLIEALARHKYPGAEPIVLRAAELELDCTRPPTRTAIVP